MPLLGALLAAGVVVALGVGPLALSPADVVALLLERLGGPAAGASDAARAVLFEIRVPRVLGAALVGATLATAGAAMQALFRNPLVEPGLVGVSSGAAVGAVATLVLVSHAPAWALPAAAFAGGLVASGVAVRCARRCGLTSVTTLLLAGVAVSALANAATGAMIVVANEPQAQSVTFWLLGSLGGATWPTLSVAGPAMAISLALLLPLARPLDLMLLGEAEAGHTGVAVEKVKLAVAALAALGVGAAVAMTGIIGFVGLVVPHLVRLVSGPAHRRLLPASALLGALLVVLADLAARTVIAPAELPIGILTALAGAPALLVLLRHGDEGGA